MDLEGRGEVAMRRKPESMSEEIGRREVREYIHRRRTNTRIYGSLLPVGGEADPALCVTASFSALPPV